ncbi:hypothetical protein [uncultured Vagococcus sp.]|uniref:hypothetical protein n=1 Tax=uncultured Vagococcus sp. TaxID=189676 RepID=UPI0028D752D0|nr:hypothetical protein [uncultured Vagococcus sp.]
MFYNGSLLVGDKTAFKTGEYETLFESDMAKEEKTSFHREVESFLLSKKKSVCSKFAKQTCCNELKKLKKRLKN